jgi:hypothetical protein
MPRYKGVFVRETEKAVLYWLDGRGEEWVPKSHVVQAGADFIVVTSWIAIQKDLIDEQDEADPNDDYDEEQMADTCHPGHPSNYGDS